MKTGKKQIQKSIRFPAKAVEIVEEEILKTLGISFNEYVRMMIVTKANEINDMPRSSLSTQLRKEIALAKKEVKQGKRKLLETDEDIHNFLLSLEKDE